MSRTDSKRQYQLVGSDPNAWLEQSLGLYVSAKALRDHFQSIRNTPPALRRIETIGLVHTALLLLGLAVENAVKAVYVARDPQIVSLDKFEGLPIKSHSGHGIKEFVSELFTLTEAESSMLDRLQEHIVWAGRYPIPISSARYHDSHHPINKRSMHPADFETARSLINRMKGEVESILAGSRNLDGDSGR